LTSYSYFTNVTSNDWLSDISLTGTYLGGNAFTLARPAFGINNSGTITRNGTGVVSSNALGVYNFNWTDFFNWSGANPDNIINSSSFTINYTYPTNTRVQATSAATAPSSLIASSEGLKILPGETIALTFKAAVKCDSTGMLANKAYISDANCSKSGSNSVTVSPRPAIAALTGTNSICLGSTKPSQVLLVVAFLVPRILQ
jgi:hypothetical protein